MQEVTGKVTNQLDMEEAKIRSVYLPIVRDQEPRSLAVFDLADSNTVTGTREPFQAMVVPYYDGSDHIAFVDGRVRY